MQSPFQLTIDISDKTAVAAAIPLLQLMLGYDFTPAEGGVVGVFPRGDMTGEQLRAAYTAPTGDAAAAFSTPAALPLGVPPAMNAAQAFQPPPLQSGTPAPMHAGAATQPNAQGAALPSFQPPPVNTGFVPPGAATGAPLGTAAQSTPPASNVELDSEGLPWDERIHAGTKTKTVPGAWKAKKGINDPAFVERVKAELRARVAGSGAAPAAVAPVQQQQPAAGAGMTLPPLGAGPFVPPGAASAPAQPVAASAPVIPTTFEDFMARISAACTSGILPMEAPNAAVVAYQLPSVTALQTNLSYVPHVWQYLQSQYPALV